MYIYIYRIKALQCPHHTKIQKFTCGAAAQCGTASRERLQQRARPSPRKTGRLQGQGGGWLSYPLPAPRKALPKPVGASDCHTAFGDQLQEMTQGPSVLPNNFTLLRLLAAWLSVPDAVLKAASYFPSWGSSPGPATTDAISSSRLFRGSNELWNVSGIISAILD